jgi:ATP-dependent HslUV protease ATP-binding subunit HslU
MQPGAFEQMLGRVVKTMNSSGRKTEKKKMKIKEARTILEEAEMEHLLEADDVVAEAIRNVEQNGIVFIDEIDKICTPAAEARFSGDASAEGVQRDLLPLVEGSTISTKYGNVKTDYVLFICSGAFHNCKPSDMVPELQGRLPIRVELQGLKEDELFRILTEPEANLIEQHRSLLKAEGVELVIEEDVIRRLAHLVAEANANVENIGARRLYTILEKVMEEYSFEAADMEEGSSIQVTLDDVENHLGDIMRRQDLQKFIL